jgi:energy-coupling factor transport system ATP-binding protein
MRVGFLGGDPADSIVGITVEEDIVFGLENLGLPTEHIEERLRWALECVGMTGIEKRPTHSLSGGEQQKLALAAMLALEAGALVLDDATAMLDRPARLSIRELLGRLRRELGLSIIQVSNDLDEVIAADRLLFLSAGEVGFDGPPREFVLSRRGERFTITSGLRRLTAALARRGALADSIYDLSDIKMALSNYIKR